MKILHLFLALTVGIILCQSQANGQGSGQLGDGQNHNGPLEGDVDFGGMSVPARPPSPIDAPGTIPHAGGTRPAATSLTPGVRSGIFPTLPPDQGGGSSASKPSTPSPNRTNPATNSSPASSDSKQYQFKVTAKESGPFNITAVVKAKDTRSPLVNSSDETPPEDARDTEEDDKKKLIKAYEAEIEKRRQTNAVLQGHIDDLAGYMLKDMLRNSVIDATGHVNQDLFNSQPKPIQDAMKEFEKGHWVRDLDHATTSIANAAQSKLSGSDDMYFVNQGKIEIERNNLFIQLLQGKIAALRE